MLGLRGHAALFFCIAIVWTHDSDDGEVHEALMITPHGIRLDDGPLQAFLNVEPRTEKLVVMCAMKETYLYGIRHNLGVKSGLALYRQMGSARHIIPSHHQPLAYKGLFMRMANSHDNERSLEWGLKEEGKEMAEGEREGLTVPNLVEVKNGTCLVLT